MSHFSNVEEYAEYRRFFYVVDFSTAISLFGLNTLLLRKPLRSLYEDIIPTIIIINVIQLIVVLFFMFIQHFTIIKYIEIVLFVALNTLYQLCVSIIVLKNLRKLYFLCTSTCFCVTVISLILLVYFNSLTFFNAYLLRILILALYNIPLCLYAGNRIWKIKFSSMKHLLSLFKEAAPIGLGVLLGSCTQYIDKFIASMMDSYQLAVYANASADIPFVGTAITTMSVFFIPIIHKCYTNKDFSGACGNISSLFLFGWYIGVSVFTLLFCNAEFVVGLLYSSQYKESVVLFRIFCMAYLLRIVSYTQLIVSLELENIIVKRMLIELVLQFALSFSLFKVLGPLGLAMSVIIVLGLWSVPYNVTYFKKRLKCKYSDIIPLKQMGIFFLKAFVPCLIVSVLLSYFKCKVIIVFFVTILVYFALNFKEIKFVFKNIK